MKRDFRPAAALVFSILATSGLVWCVIGLSRDWIQLLVGLLVVVVPGILCLIASVRCLRTEGRLQNAIRTSDPQVIRSVLENEDVAALLGEQQCRELYDTYCELAGDDEASRIPKPWEGSQSRWSWRPVWAGGLLVLAIMLAAALVALLNRDVVRVGTVEFLAVGGSLVFFAAMYSVHQYSRHKRGIIWTRKVFGVILWSLLLLVLLVFLIGGAIFMGLT